MNVPSIWVGLLCWAASLLFTVFLSLLLSRQLKTERPALDLAACVFLWIWLTTGFTLAMGLAGWLRPGPFGVISGLGILLLLSRHETRASLHSEWGRWRGLLRRATEAWRELPRWMRWLSALFVSLSVIRFAFLIWALPPFVWDSLTYHLTNVAQWVQDGRIGLFETPIPRVYLPANYEVFTTWFALFIHHDIVVEASGLAAYTLAGISMFSIGRGLGLSTSGSWAAALAFLSTPALVYATTGTKNDPFLAAIFLLGIALVLHLRESLLRDQVTPVLAYLLLLGTGLLYALGTKAYILLISPALLVILFWPGPNSRVRELWTNGVTRFWGDLRARSRSVRVLFCVLAAGGLFLGGFWNLRNWVLKGNPFYPYQVRVGEQVLAPGEEGFKIALERLWENVEVLARKFGDKRERILPDLPETTGWGWLAYGMGFVAAAWATLHLRSFRPLTGGFAVSLVLLMLSSTTSPWNMRYFIWFPAILSAGIGAFLDRSWAAAAAPNRALPVLFSLGMALNMIMSVNYNLVPFRDIAAMLALPAYDRDSGRLHVRVPDEYESVYQFVPREARLGYNVHANGFVYPLYRADFSQQIVYVPATENETCEAIAEAMAVRGTRYLLVAPENTPDLFIAKLRECAEAGVALRERAGGLYVIPSHGG